MKNSSIELIYKCIYNYFVKAEGSTFRAPSIAGGLTGLSIFAFLVNIYFIISIISNNNTVLLKMSKATAWIVFGLYMILNHFLIFKIFKFSKNGDSANNLFNITKGETKLGWLIFTTNILAMLILPFFKHYYFYGKF